MVGSVHLHNARCHMQMLLTLLAQHMKIRTVVHVLMRLFSTKYDQNGQGVSY